ncbi:MAG: HDOD domain-containing protein [Gammaproteobacteria bacterium]|nr:HDOD domain-containing protein [Gammaproteobacteria bacterium]
MADFFVGRQPIVDGRGRTVAYELLFRQDPAVAAAAGDPYGAMDGDVATAQVIAGIHGGAGLKALSGGRRLFINATRHTLTSGLFTTLPPESVVVEVLEDVEVDETLVRELHALKKAGYRIALDDWTERSRQQALLPLADIIKVEIPAFSSRALAETTKSLLRRRLMLLAEKVETREQHALCESLGFKLFQGHLYARPRLIRNRQLNPVRRTALRMLSELQHPNIDLGDVSLLITQDPGFAIRVLRLCNSALVSGSRSFADIPTAVSFLGTHRLQQLASLIAFSGLGASTEDGELLRVALTRARACELLASRHGADASAAFLVGLVSMAERMLGIEVAVLAEEMALAETSRRALAGEDSSPLGGCLARVLAFEAPGSQTGDDMAQTRRFGMAYIEAMRWANEVIEGSLGAESG